MCLGSAISKEKRDTATRSRVVVTVALRMFTCASDRTRVTSDSRRVRSSASTWMFTRNSEPCVGAQSTFLVNIQVEALDRNRLLSDITMALSDAHVNILSANLSTTRDRVAKSRFSFEMADAAHLDGVLRAVRAVPGVFDAYRVTA